MSGQFQVYCKVNQIYIYTCVCVCLYTCTNVYPLFFQIHLPNRSYRVLRRVSVLYSRSLLIIYFICSSVYIREGNGTPLQYSCLENPMDRGAWQAEVHGVTKSRTRLSDFTFTFHFHALEKEMATHSSVLAWRIPGTGEPGGLPSMGLHRVGHD